MARKRFRWTRARYKKADHLRRYFNRHVYDLPSEPPSLLERYWELWRRHPQAEDPLLDRTLRARLWDKKHDESDDIPF